MVTRIQRLWTKIYALRLVLNNNPHVKINEARSLAKEIEQLAMVMRLREIKEKLRR